MSQAVLFDAESVNAREEAIDLLLEALGIALATPGVELKDICDAVGIAVYDSCQRRLKEVSN